MSTRKAKLLYLFTTIVFILACAPAIALTPYPTTDPNEINTIIVLTANAASTQTAAAMPTATFTPSMTPTRPTETPSPTETPTVIFILSTPTKMVVPTFTFIPTSGSGSGSGSGGSSGSSSDPYACQILSVSPANGTTMNKESDFDATWKVKNIGTRTWDKNSVDFIYLSGTEMNKRPGYDLSGNVKSGQQISLGADMVSPQKSGNYSTTWALRVGDNEFCKMSLTINVK